MSEQEERSGDVKGLPGGRFGRRVTLVEVVVVAVVIGLFACVMVPWLLEAREEARQASCLQNMKQLGLGLLYHESALSRFPPSCGVLRNDDGTVADMQARGWSWCIYIEPYMPGGSPLSESRGLDVKEYGPLDKVRAAQDALGSAPAVFHCPSSGGTTHLDPQTQREAITNYKAMGATHLGSLLVASPTPSVPKYNPEGTHPDGALFPGSTHGVYGMRSDGTSGTFLLCESVEQNVARWTVGVETCVVGLPQSVTYADRAASGQPLKYFCPEGYTVNRFWDESTIPPENNLKYIDWDYDAKPYVDTLSGVPLVPRSARASGPMKYGPSSHHVGKVNHLYGDGSVHAIAIDIDAAAYMFQITRNGHDPGW